MKPTNIINTEKPSAILAELMNRLHYDGPIKQEDLETLSYLKYFHSKIFQGEEKKLMYLLGLFYKIEDPEDLLSLSYSIFSQAIFEETGQNFTPIQASIRNKILENKYFSFSAPTSAGKSFLFRELIKYETGDIVIVVPSRALIAEYILAVRNIITDRKDILILQFIDNVNRKRTKRKIFIVTPERASEIFKLSDQYNPSLFLYDEAQISEEKVRGIKFDAFVRRAERIFPQAKKIFAHPFVENPQAQLKKHNFTEHVDSMTYQQNTVGKIYLEYDEKKDIFECFSPFIEGAHLKKNKNIFKEDIVKTKLLGGGSILVYITKDSIYSKSFEKNFEHYTSLCEPITDPTAINIINEIEELIGAKDKQSEIVDLMKKGIVIHHGSIPLNVRFLIEKFTNAGFAKICFATSTLIQGVNMPFDIVWIENANFEGTKEDKTLGLKNLIGRAGRSSSNTQFDYGFVIVKNVKNFVERFNGKSQLSEISQLEKSHEDASEDLIEFIDAIKNNEINDDYNLPNSKADRLKSAKARDLIRAVLDFLFNEDKIMSGSDYRELSKTKQKILKESLAGVYELSLGRKLFLGEKSILSASITILLWQIQGKSFMELLGLRYSYLTNQKEQQKIKREVRERKITQEECNNRIANFPIEFSVIPHQLPNSTLTYLPPSRFGIMKVKDLNYDLVVYDTYDFLDKVISFSLSDVFIAAFDQFYIQENDDRAKKMVNYFRYGTNENEEIWLMRYGFSIEEAEQIKKHIISINEDEILFSQDINNPQNIVIKKMVERYL